jgi:hypothetical protein
MLGGLSKIFVELNSTCNKHTLCAFCGHQNPAVHPTRQDGVMPDALVASLAQQLPRGMEVSFHRDGDVCAYPADVGVALDWFAGQLRTIVTHGEQLGVRAQEVIGHCEAVCVSVFRGDPDRELQLTALRAFLATKGDRLPRVSLKVVGDMGEDELAAYRALDVPILHRLLHISRNNRRYAGGWPAMPESGLCLDLLHVPSVAWDGRVFLCNRLSPEGHGVIGDLTTQTLDEIWNGPARQAAIQAHLHGRRADVPLCADCRYYGIPTA